MDKLILTHWALQLWPTDVPLPWNSRIQADYQLLYQWFCCEDPAPSVNMLDRKYYHETHPPILSPDDTLRVYFMFVLYTKDSEHSEHSKLISKPKEVRLRILGDVPEKIPHGSSSPGVPSGDPLCYCWPGLEDNPFTICSAKMPEHTPEGRKKKIFSFDVKVIVHGYGDQEPISYGVDPEMIVGEDRSGLNKNPPGLGG